MPSPTIVEIEFHTPGQGLHDVTAEVSRVVAQSRTERGLCVVYIRHTSASLLIQENADPSAKRDLERWLCRLVPEGDSLFLHTEEGPDDMPAHVKAAITATSLSIPVMNGRLALGTWQGIYVWEHRRAAHTRRVVVYVA
jgi:secondary thiamine-phosphate synthase enzyme